jgi:hypothetical protein
MKKLRMIVASVIILAIVCCAFAFNAKKIWKFCYSDTFDGVCQASPANLKRVTVGTEGSVKKYYVPCWEGEACNSSSGCTVAAGFIAD